MKIEYIHDLTDGGKYKQVVSENLIRLFDFDKIQTNKLISLITEEILIKKDILDFSKLDFIESINCNLILMLSSEDKGIIKSDNAGNFKCYLTEESYNDFIEIMESVDKGYNWLCVTSDENIDFLYSPGGTW
jgi:hypothetical protein